MTCPWAFYPTVLACQRTDGGGYFHDHGAHTKTSGAHLNKQSICRCVVASLLSITAASWAQTSVGLGRADYKDNCASCHGASGKGDGPMHSFLLKPPSDLTRIAQRHGGQFPQELMWEVIDGRWSGDGGPHGSREMPVWGQEFKARAMTEPGDSPRTAEWSARQRIASLLKYLETIQQP